MASEQQAVVFLSSTDVTLLIGFLSQERMTFQEARNEVMVGMIDRADKALRDSLEFHLHDSAEKLLKDSAVRWLETRVPGAVQLMPVELVNDLTTELQMVWKFALHHVNILAERAVKGWEDMANVSAAEREKNKIRADTLRRFVEVFLPFT